MRITISLLAVALVAAGCSAVPSLGASESSQRPSVTVNVSPVVNYIPGHDNTPSADSSAWGEATEGSRTGTSTPTNTANPNVNLTPGGVSLAPSKPGADPQGVDIDAAPRRSSKVMPASLDPRPDFLEEGEVPPCAGGKCKPCPPGGG